jgi:hypothetical protein
VTPLNEYILNVFEPTTDNISKLSHCYFININIISRIVCWFESIPFVFISVPCQKDFLILLVPAREMLQNTIQFSCTEEQFFSPIIDYWLLLAKFTLVWFDLIIAEFVLRFFFNTQQNIFLYVVMFLCWMLLLVSAGLCLVF